ncbi:hypothetical protein Tco_0011758, partial [Tanacetum coccineum]
VCLPPANRNNGLIRADNEGDNLKWRAELLDEQGLVIAALKNELRKLKGKALDKEATETHSVDPKVSKDNMEPITPKLLNKRTAHSLYIKHTQEEALVLRDIVEHVERITKKKTKNKAKTTKPDSEWKRLSQPSGNTRNDRILQTPSSNSKTKVEAQPRNNSKKHDNSNYVCINGDDCMSSDNLCVSNSMNDVKFRAKSKKRKSKKEIWKPTGKVFNKMGYIWRPTGRPHCCREMRPLTRKPRKYKNTESVSKTKVVQIVLWYLDSGCSKQMTGDRSQLTNFISKFLGTVKFGNDQVANIMGYGDYQIGNVTISRASSSISLDFGAINHLARHGLVRGLPKLKFEKDHLCSACALGKSSKKPHKPKSEDTNQEKL